MMNERLARRIAAIAGIVFVVGVVVAVVLVIPAPMPDKSTAKIVKWFADHRGAAYTSAMLTGVSSLAFLWFLGYVHHAVTRAAAGARWLASVLLTSGIVAITIAMVAAIPFALLAITAGRPGVDPNEGVVRMLVDFNWAMITLDAFGLAAFLATLGLLFGDGVLRPRWASWVAHLGAVLGLVGAIGGFYVSKSGKPNPTSLLGLIATIILVIVVIAISIDLLAPETRDPSATPR